MRLFNFHWKKNKNVEVINDVIESSKTTDNDNLFNNNIELYRNVLPTPKYQILSIDTPYSSKYIKSENMWLLPYSDDKNMRIIVEFKPVEDCYYFYGEAKPKSNWVIYNILKVNDIDDETFVETVDFIENDIPRKIEKLRRIIEIYNHFKDDGLKISEIEE